MKKKVLVVEDEPITALSMSDLLEMWGYETCEPASTGQEAISRTEQERPNIVLMDINLKGEVDGIETAKRIRNRFRVPVIFVTGYVDEYIRKEAELAEPRGYLIKPLDFSDLKSLLDEVEV
jgi:CheY-like chemotaxis protein